MGAGLQGSLAGSPLSSVPLRSVGLGGRTGPSAGRYEVGLLHVQTLFATPCDSAARFAQQPVWLLPFPFPAITVFLAGASHSSCLQMPGAW